MQIRAWLGCLMICAGLSTAQTAPATDEQIWTEFESFSQKLTPQAPGATAGMRARYLEALKANGVPQAEAVRRYDQINTLRRASVEREKVYWDASFKSGGGPSAPLRLLQEALYKVKPGRALDAGMGRGRNTIYLASTGWEATGYDMSADALKVAQGEAAKAGMKITTVEAKHEDFAFGEDQWDLIVCAYCYMQPSDARWPPVFLKALRKGGLVVFQTSVGGQPSWSGLSENWKGFHILRMEDLDAGVVDNDWAPSRSYRTVALVVRKE
ncbi:MAG: class I SAM-dependent methyltransferase [Acidobacteria bacterium]|nr:class I SAM-dependent methyltransferase [Acidobacteriota bacterium]